MHRQFLDPPNATSVEEVVRRLCGVQAQVASSAELTIRLRQRESAAGAVTDALANGRLLRTWAMRGTIHLVTPEEAGAFLSLLAAGRSWEVPSWQRYFGMRAEDWDLMRSVVREALDGPPLTRDELNAAIVRVRKLRHLAEELRSGWGTLFKPLAWQGDLCFGPSRGTTVTFTRPDRASARWAGVPDPEEAAPAAIAAYLRAYGPATATSFSNFVSHGRISARFVRGWFARLGDQLAELDVEGESAYVLAEDEDELRGWRPTRAVRLVAGFDQYVLGPGTDDGRVVPPARRRLVSKQSGWIAAVVIARGVVGGTWRLDGTSVRVDWFPEAGRVPRAALAAESVRLSSIVGAPLRLAIQPL
jgi:hypothetical protein